MTFRQRLGLGVPPILLRVCLAVTFIWAGAGKHFGRVDLTPEQAAVFDAIRTGSAPTPAPADPPADADSTPTAMADGALVILAQDQGAQPEEQPAETPTQPDADADADTSDAEPAAAADQAGSHRTVDLIAVLFHTWATPNDQGRALLPGFIAQGKTAWYLAIALLVVEALGGIMVAVGLLTRLWALALAGVMLGALWTTSIGPVVVYGQPGWPTFMPILPALDNFNPGAWQTWLWQFSLMCGALSLACLGAGRLSLDRWFFGKPGADQPEPIIVDEDED
ncbi:MAG: DoxX family protein [Planctomycetota bacterium]|nr:MAG: DoxX family protein [Planctomycetota bacterium]